MLTKQFLKSSKLECLSSLQECPREIELKMNLFQVQSNGLNMTDKFFSSMDSFKKEL